jgi:predicted AAA+ superfamily ATPase
MYKKLLTWKEHGSKHALMVTGARQVGKTYLIREFLKENYEDFAEINLIDNSQAVAALESANNSDDIMLVIEAIVGRKLIPGKTAIFIDEVQKFKEIVTAIKFLVDKNDYDFILSGSLLGVELVSIRSIPVGYMHSLTMYPLDFEEFCWANGVTEDIFNLIKEAFTSKTPLNDFYHQHFLDIFYKYLIIGGMPDAVNALVEDKSIPLAREIQQNICEQYKRDITQYYPARALQVRSIFDLIPSELNKNNKRFRLNSIKKGTTIGRYENDFLWLAGAGVALPNYVVDEPKHPLLLSKKSRLFKLFSSDVGLLTSSFISDVTLDILSKNVNINYGSIYENVVAQELTAHGFNLYYYNSKRYGELDFVLESRTGMIIPVEVKSGKDYRRHVALSNIMEVADYVFADAFVLCDANVKVKDKVTYLPIYMASCLTPDFG